jgi:hypothetical protein
MSLEYLGRAAVCLVLLFDLGTETPRKLIYTDFRGEGELKNSPVSIPESIPIWE